jgi:ABC-type transport system substrate-binding protein
MPSGFPSKFTILLLLCTLLTITVGAMQGQDEAGPYVNSVGVHLPPDAAPPDAQVLTTFELNNRFMDHAFTSYQKVFGFALINEPLVRVDRNFNLIPAAATHWEVTADGRTWIFHIRPNLIYNDGRPLNAHNYVAMFRRWADPETAFDFEWYYRPIRNWSASIASRVPPDSIGVQASDDLTLMVTTERPAPYMPGLLSYTWVASDHAIEKHGQAWSTSVETSVSSGPFQLREWLQGDRIVLEPNPHYRGPAKPYLERVVAKLYSAVAPPPFLPAYEAGETDYILLTNQAEINRIKTDPTLQAQLNTYADFATLYLTMNTYHPPFNDIRVRQALVGYRYDYVDASNLLTLWLSNGRHAWRNERFEALVLEANELVGDSERRMALYQEAEKILVSDVGAVFLWYPLLNEMWKPHVRGEALEPNRWGYRAWRGDQMQDVTPTLYITNEVMKGRASTAIRQSSDFWQWLMK